MILHEHYAHFQDNFYYIICTYNKYLCPNKSYWLADLTLNLKINMFNWVLVCVSAEYKSQSIKSFINLI